MTRLVIPIVGGAVNAHQKFEVQLGDNLVQFELDYKTLLNQWSLNILIADERIINGAMLEPGSNIIAHWNLTETMGKFIFIGKTVTLDNIGIENYLVWISPDE